MMSVGKTRYLGRQSFCGTISVKGERVEFTEEYFPLTNGNVAFQSLIASRSWVNSLRNIASRKTMDSSEWGSQQRLVTYLVKAAG